MTLRHGRLALVVAAESLPIGPGNRDSIELLGDNGLTQLDSPFDDDRPLSALAAALGDIEPDSVLRGVSDLIETYGIDAVSFAASLFGDIPAGIVTLVAATGACFSGSPQCVAQVLTGALMITVGAVLWATGVGWAVRLAIQVLKTVAETAVQMARGASWLDIGIAVGTALLVGQVVRTSKLGARLTKGICGSKRTWCLDAATTPETAVNAVKARGPVGILKLDRANASARRTEAFRGTPRRTGFDRDEFPLAATRQGGKGARIAYTSPSDNRAAGASFRAATSGLEDGEHFVYLVVNSRDRPLVALDSIGATPALLSEDEED